MKGISSDPLIWKPVFINLVLPNKVACSQDRVKCLLDRRFKILSLDKTKFGVNLHHKSIWRGSSLKSDLSTHTSCYYCLDLTVLCVAQRHQNHITVPSYKMINYKEHYVNLLKPFLTLGFLRFSKNILSFNGFLIFCKNVFFYEKGLSINQVCVYLAN